MRRAINLTHLDWPAGMVIAIGVLAAAVRFYRLTGRSLWLDETVTAQSAHLNTVGDVIAQSTVYVNQAPLFYLVTWILRPWGDGEFVLRLPAAVAGTLTVLAVFLVGKRAFGIRVGLIAALLMAVLPYAVWYSQEARNYALFMLLTTMQTYFAYAAVKFSRRLDWLGLAVFTTLNLYNHYLALAATAGVAVYVGLFLGLDLLSRFSNRMRAVSAAIVVAVAAAAAFVPWRSTLRSIFVGGGTVAAAAQLHPAYALAAVFSSAVVLAGFGVVIRRSSRQVKLAAATSLVLVLVVAILAVISTPSASPDGRLALRYVVPLVFVALALAVAAALLALDLLRPWPELARRIELATGAAALIALAYTPWLPYLRLALSRPDVTVQELHLARPPTLDDVLSVMGRLGISGLMLIFFVLGFLAIVVWLFRGRREESALLLCSLLVPIAVLRLTSGPAIVAIDIRYLAFLVPSAMLVIAAGVEGVTLVILRAVQHWRSRPWPRMRVGAAAPAAVITTLLLVQTVPALASSYQIPKEDYRSAAEHIVSSSPAASMLIPVGNYSDWSLITFGYYLHELHSPLPVVDGSQLTSDTASTLADSSGTVWGVVIFPSAAQLQLLSSPGAEQVDFVDVTKTIYLVRATDRGLTPAQQARELLAWEMPLEPQLRAVGRLMDLLSGQARLGPDLASDPTSATPGAGWSIQPGVRVDGNALVMAPGAVNAEQNATFTGQIQAGVDYVVSFEYSNEALSGWQRVYAIALDQSGHGTSTFPSGAGYQALQSSSWSKAAFAFEAPPGTAAVTLILRTHGTGTAQFRSVDLNPVADS
ncbi:MAG: glycosyltransferase family 39 protein [Candidatus Dormibacterales bacterium]